MSEIPEIPDYNKIYNTSSYSSPHPLDSVPHPQIQSTAMSTNPHPSQPMKTTVNNSSSYGPLDYGYGMTPVSTTHTNSTVNMTPFQAPASSNDQQHASSSGSAGQGHRRSSMSNLFNSMVGVNNSQQIPMRKTVSQSATTNINNSGRRRSSIAKFLMPDPQPNGGGASLGRRRSSAFTSLGYKTDAGGDEHKGPYAHVSRSQAEHMDRIREAEKNLHLTHNKDGLPLPKDNMMQSGGRRRSSLAKILGFDKPLLAR